MSTNPYAQTSAGAAAPVASPEQQQASDYELAVGPNNDYYIPKFQEFDTGGSQVGWHWPAFFVTSPWFLYRKMYGVGVLNLLYPWFLLFSLSITFAITQPPVAVMVIVSLLLLFAPTFVLPVYANTLYWRQARKVIRNIPSSFTPDKRAARIERNGGTAVGPMIGILLGLGFFGIGGIGILAAIAIPAYQDYTIRAQVAEGLNLASGTKAAVAEFHARTGEWPADSAAAEVEIFNGQFVESVVVESGSIVIKYGAAAHQNIRGQRVALLPSVDAAGDVFWACGNRPTPDGWTPAEGPSGSDIPDKYLPANCRSGT